MPVHSRVRPQGPGQEVQPGEGEEAGGEAAALGPWEDAQKQKG